MKKILTVSCALITGISMAQELSVAPVVVKDRQIEVNINNVEDLSVNGIYGDGGEALNSIPGVSIQRKGGHGNDPVIRGQKENRLNVKVGDRFIHGGCPSRMDPPSSYISTELYESIEIHKGIYTLTEGRGGPAGTIIYRENDPRLKDKSFAGKVGGGYADNSNTKVGFTQLDFGGKKIQARVKHSQKEALDYKDGNNEMVESSFNNQSTGANLYWNPIESLKSVLKYEVNKTKDARYSALGMDAPKADLSAIDFKISKKLEGFFKEVEFSSYQSNVAHIMNNKDRVATMEMEVDSTAKTTGGRLLGKFAGDNYVGKVGIDFQNIAQLAEKKHNGALNTYMWPDSQINQTGAFAEFEQSNGLKYGMRVDSVSAEAKKANSIANMMAGSASEAYSSVYGTKYEKKVETNIGALVRYTKEYSSKLKSFVGFSRTVRTADVNERFIHKFASGATSRETGNPDINPEKHTQLDIGVNYNQQFISMNASVYYNDVKDFISVDRARGQDGVTISDGRAIYRNVDAKIMGLEFETKRTFDNGHYLSFVANYTYGDNTTDKRPLYEIPPVEYKISHGIIKGKWSSEFSLNGATAQSRVDKDSSNGSGVDYATTKGWLTADISGTYQFQKNWKLNAGIKNITDQAYAKHLNMRDILTTQQVRVNEPGRSVWVNTTYTF